MRWSESRPRRGDIPPAHGGTKARETSEAKELATLVLSIPHRERIGMRNSNLMVGRWIIGSLAAAAAAMTAAGPAEAAPKTDFKVAWSIYVGWMPWGFAADNGIVRSPTRGRILVDGELLPPNPVPTAGSCSSAIPSSPI